MSSSLTTQDPPEAQGPGTYDELSGSVRYGAEIRPRIGPMPARDASARHLREPGYPANVTDAPAHGCQRCAGIPDAVLTPLADAVAAGKAAR